MSYIDQKNKVLPTGEDLGGAYAEENLEGAGAFAVIFDMDGTLVDNTPFHYKAWQQLFKLKGLPELSNETYKAEISGVPIANTVRKYFGNADEATVSAITHEKQHLYQQAFLPHLKAISGLENFLAKLKHEGVKMALATSSDKEDVNFIFNAISISQYFDAVITGSMVNEPKPSPQIFLKAAEELNTDPANCVVFEDSTAGLKAGNAAGMKVVGITTAHPAAVISKVARLVIDNYVELTPQQLAALFE